LARVPIYVAVETAQLVSMWRTLAVATVGVIAGTLSGERLLARLPEKWFRTVIGALLLLLGVSFLIG
jgi:uncharacterized membrane protein YfcA